MVLRDLDNIDRSEKEPQLAIFGRLLWFIIGPISLLVLTALILITGSGWLTVYDLAFYITVGLMLCGRWVEIHTGHGRTAFSQPATPEHFRHYAVRLLPWAVLVWTVANFIGNHLLRML